MESHADPRSYGGTTFSDVTSPCGACAPTRGVWALSTEEQGAWYGAALVEGLYRSKSVYHTMYGTHNMRTSFEYARVSGQDRGPLSACAIQVNGRGRERMGLGKRGRKNESCQSQNMGKTQSGVGP